MNILYILMRSDLASLNPGKAIAQGSHATSQFHGHMERFSGMLEYTNGAEPKGLLAKYVNWVNETDGGFGTALILDVVANELRDVISLLKLAVAAGELEAAAGLVTDPTYPIRDGDVTHHFPLTTCGWVFGDKTDLAPFLEGLSLYK